MKYKEEEKKVLIELMKVKLKDERKHLEVLHRVRERARKWLKDIVGKSRKYSNIIRQLRIEMKGRRKEAKRKYDAKLDHLKLESDKLIEKN